MKNQFSSGGKHKKHFWGQEWKVQSPLSAFKALHLSFIRQIHGQIFLCNSCFQDISRIVSGWTLLFHVQKSSITQYNP